MFSERIVVAANKALNAIDRMRAGRNAIKLSDRKRAKEEMSSLFRTKRPKIQKKCAWRHTALRILIKRNPPLMRPIKRSCIELG